jgi:hypothetical protein
MEPINSLKQQLITYEVNIDFDEASNSWKQNKKSIGNGQYKYICSKDKINGTKCGRVCYKNTEFCWLHRNQKPNNN